MAGMRTSQATLLLEAELRTAEAELRTVQNRIRRRLPASPSTHGASGAGPAAHPVRPTVVDLTQEDEDDDEGKNWRKNKN
jgi:hypothetical protein